MNEYYEYFGPDYQLDVKASNMDDNNSRAYMERVKGIVLENLRSIGGPPSVQMSGEYRGCRLDFRLTLCPAQIFRSDL